MTDKQKYSPDLDALTGEELSLLQKLSHSIRKFVAKSPEISNTNYATRDAHATTYSLLKGSFQVYEEFKGTGNMELVLDRKLQEKRVFPAIDIQKSGTRREDLLLSKEEQEAVYIMRKALNGMKSEDAVEQILNMFTRTKNNAEFVQTVKKQKFI